MRIRLEKRLTPSRFMLVATPVASVLLTMALGAVIFELLGFDGPDAIYQTFITPIVAPYKWVDVLTKAAPLIIIALGLSLGNQAKIWNIGAEGQYVIGALAGAGVAFAMPQAAPGFVAVPAMIVAGIIGGMAWAAIPALLKTRFRVSEVLSTLMLVYVAMQVLNYLIGGPWKDPNGHNFPQTPPFSATQSLPNVIPGTVVPPGFVVAIALTLVFWVLASRSVYGFSVRTVGAAPSAARYGGFDAARTVWSTLMISGGMAGLAGILEAMSQLGQINLGFPSGYGFTAIIVSFLGRLHPVGVFLAGLILAVTYVGGQVAQTAVHVPEATAGIFQATMLFLILASDILVRYRLRLVRAAPRAATAGAPA
ncbi:nucleoside ABC transporter membrane protein [Roseiarcus fermentans]|uniref:Nucleoside ABC transporter membrane protein n=1 Tax=Roseiarcus fermentans TaxID=1473586 RepID=A0A366EYB7_9HYPH|nr:ABC transporter permease [Roseiarcus fermentans]RBP07388.1 nucleoside ABC transporter membrane protein [Roseiarcus fermentans]